MWKVWTIVIAIIIALSGVSYQVIKKNAELSVKLLQAEQQQKANQQKIFELGVALGYHQDNIRRSAKEAQERLDSPDTTVEVLEGLIEEKSK